MRFLTGVALLFYVMTISVIGGVTILFVTHILLLKEVNDYLTIIYADMHMRGLIAGIGSALIVLSFIFARIISGGRQKERTIAFDNPSGRVIVSLGAIEDLVRRLMYKLSEIKEVKLHIIKTKKGIDVEARLILKAEVSIPDITSRLQDLIKTKIEETLGIDEPVMVRIHVVKIVGDENKAKRSKTESEEKLEQTAVPFHGYRR